MGKCYLCSGTGKYQKPKDGKEYDRVFDKYDDMGIFSLGECRKKALDEVGYDVLECPNCKGTGKEEDEKVKASVLKEKFGIQYYAELGIIDFFGLSLSKDDLKARVNFDFEDSYGSNQHSFYQRIDIADVDDMVEEIKQIIKENTGEEPVVVRFFAIPDFEYLGFNLCPIAKITNNGSTFVFSKDIKIFECLNEVNRYVISIEEI